MNPIINPIFNQLREQIRHAESGGRINDGDIVKNGCEAIDRLLPQHGYPRGTLVQWLTGGGHGADYLSLRVAQQACLDGGALVIIDPLNQFFPPAAAALGINLDNVIVLRTGPADAARDLLWAIDQSLRCPAVAAVWGPIAEIDDRWFRRFQLSAEASGCLGLFVQPPVAAKRPTWAEVQWLVGMGSGRPVRTPFKNTPVPSLSSASLATTATTTNEQAIHLQLTRCRGTQTGKSIHVTINHITGNVQPTRRPYEPSKESRKTSTPTSAEKSAHRLSVAAQLVDPANGRRRA